MAKTFAIAAAALVFGALGCERGTMVHSDEKANAANLIDVARTTPTGWAQTSASYPTGWADAAERRQQELDFAAGADPNAAPPSAIGGGPTSFD